METGMGKLRLAQLGSCAPFLEEASSLLGGKRLKYIEKVLAKLKSHMFSIHTLAPYLFRERRVPSFSSFQRGTEDYAMAQEPVRPRGRKRSYFQLTPLPTGRR